jgi:hypothetical protein
VVDALIVAMMVGKLRSIIMAMLISTFPLRIRAAFDLRKKCELESREEYEEDDNGLGHDSDSLLTSAFELSWDLGRGATCSIEECGNGMMGNDGVVLEVVSALLPTGTWRVVAVKCMYPYVNRTRRARNIPLWCQLFAVSTPGRVKFHHPRFWSQDSDGHNSYE